MASQRIVWLNGNLVPEGEALISPFDHGLTAGDGCFETLVTYWKTPFAFTRHYNRLLISAEKMGIKNLPDKAELFKAAKMVIEENKLVDPVRVRITVTGGIAGLDYDREAVAGTVLVCAAQAPDLGESCKVGVAPYSRNEGSATAGINTISRIENVLVLMEARERGRGEAIMGNTKGNLCEGSGSNIFWVKDGTVCTPPLSAGILPGITRELVLELCGELGIPVKEADAPMSMLETVQEVFLTSTTREVQPVVGIDDRRLFPGATTLRLRKAYKDMVEDDLDP